MTAPDPDRTEHEPARSAVPSATALESLVLEILDGPDSQRDAKIAAVCEQYPELAGEIRSMVGAARVTDAGIAQFRRAEIELPARFGRFVLVEKLGKGGQGAVFLAEDRGLGRRLAIKMLLTEDPDDRQLARFRREAETASKLQHPGICTVYDFGEIDGVPFLAMQFVEGSTLAAVLDGERERTGRGAVAGPRDRSTVLRHVARIARAAEALHAAHQHELVHRDIKPSNIMIDPEGAPVLLDFGLARDELATDKSSGVLLLGTPGYMSPEQVTPRAKVDYRTDIFSLGIVLFECVTYRRPFPGPTFEDFTQQLLFDKPRASDFSDDLPPGLDTVLARVLRKKPADRYQTAADFAADLRRVEQGREIRGATARGRLWRGLTTNPVLATVAIAVLVVTAALASAQSATAALVITALALGTALAVALLRLAWLTRKHGEGSQALERVRALSLAHAAAEALVNDPMLGLMLARTAVRTAALPETLSQLSSALVELQESRAFEHEAKVSDLAFTPGGDRLVTTSADYLARCFDVQGEGARVLEGHAGPIRALAIAPDGRYAATASDDTSVRVWELGTGTCASILRGHERPVVSVRFSPDGERLVTASYDGTARIWGRDGTQLHVLAHGADSFVWTAAFAPDGRRIATGGSDKVLRVWTADGTSVASLAGHESWIYRIEFGRSASTVVTASGDGTARVWDLDTGSHAVARGHDDYVMSACFLGDEHEVLTASWDKTARIWRQSGEPLAVLHGHEGGLEWACASPDERFVLTAAGDQTARLFDRKGNTIQVFAGHGHKLTKAVFSPDGRLVATASEDGTARIYDLVRNDLPILRHSNTVYCVREAADGSALLTACADGSARIWSQSGEMELELTGHRQRVRCIDISPCGSRILTASADTTARLWTRDGELLRELVGHDRSVTSCAFSPNGDRVLTASDDTTARLWDGEGNLLRELKSHQSEIMGVSWSEQGDSILTAGRDGRVALWDGQGRLQKVIPVHAMGINAVQFNAAGDGFLIGADDGTATLWSIEHGCLATCRGHGGAVLSVDISRGGRYLLTGSRDKTACLWSADGKRQLVFRAHRGPVWTVRFLRGVRRFVTASQDGTARVWAFEAQELLELADKRCYRTLTAREASRYGELLDSRVNRAP